MNNPIISSKNPIIHVAAPYGSIDLIFCISQSPRKDLFLDVDDDNVFPFTALQRDDA